MSKPITRDALRGVFREVTIRKVAFVVRPWNRFMTGARCLEKLGWNLFIFHGRFYQMKAWSN